MDIGVEISLYPLAADYRQRIQAFLDRMRSDGRLKVVTTSLSTQVFGPYEEVLGLLGREMRATFSDVERAVFVMKVFGPLAEAGG